MLSRAEVRRRRLELLLRCVVLAALTVLFWLSLRQPPNVGGAAIDARGITTSGLANWSRAPVAPKRIAFRLDNVPSRVERAWLRALAAAGSAVQWSGDLTPVMADVEPLAEPAGGALLRVAAPSGTSAMIDDDIGPIDTVRLQGSGATLALRSNSEVVRVRAKASVASVAVSDSSTLHRILVIGAPGWESKFTTAALEENGWKVDVLSRVAPAVDVTSRAIAEIDTSRYSAVVALDASAAPYLTRLTSFVRAGGGLILAPSAAAVGAMAPLRVKGRGAIPLEKRGATTTVAATRLGAGRVIQIAYEDTWRSRMNGGDSAPAEHRRLWTSLVGNVAYAPRVARLNTDPARRAVPADDPAPLADLTAAIGPGLRSSANAMTGGDRSNWLIVLFTLLTLALLGEVASRRLRGVS